MDRFHFTTAYRPLVVVTCPARLTTEDTARFLDEYTRDVLDTKLPFVLVIDAMHVAEVPNAAVRRQISEWTTRVEHYGGHVVLGSTAAMRSAVVRGAMTAIHWIVPPKVEFTFHKTLAEAVDAATVMVERAKLPLGASVDAYRRELERTTPTP